MASIATNDAEADQPLPDGVRVLLDDGEIVANGTEEDPLADVALVAANVAPDPQTPRSNKALQFDLGHANEETEEDAAVVAPVGDEEHREDAGAEEFSDSDLGDEMGLTDFSPNFEEEKESMRFMEKKSPKYFHRLINKKVRVAPGCPLKPPLIMNSYGTMHDQFRQKCERIAKAQIAKQVLLDKEFSDMKAKFKGTETVVNAACEHLYKDYLKRSKDHEKSVNAANASYLKAIGHVALSGAALQAKAKAAKIRCAELYSHRHNKKEKREHEVELVTAQRNENKKLLSVHSVDRLGRNKPRKVATKAMGSCYERLYEDAIAKQSKFANLKQQSLDQWDENNGGVPFSAPKYKIDEMVERLYPQRKLYDMSIDEIQVRKSNGVRPESVDARHHLLYSDSFRREADRRIEMKRREVIQQKQMGISSVHPTRHLSSRDLRNLTDRLSAKTYNLAVASRCNGFRGKARQLLGSQELFASVGPTPQASPSGVAFSPQEQSFASTSKFSTSVPHSQAHSNQSQQEDLSGWVSTLQQTGEHAIEELQKIYSVLNTPSSSPVKLGFQVGQQMHGMSPIKSSFDPIKLSMCPSKTSLDVEPTKLVDGSPIQENFREGNAERIVAQSGASTPMTETPTDTPLDAILFPDRDMESSLEGYMEEFVSVTSEIGLGRPQMLGNMLNNILPVPELTIESITMREAFRSFVTEKMNSVEEAFKSIDTDGSGSISKQEFVDFITELEYCGAHEAQKLYLVFLDNGDVRLTMDELVGDGKDPERLVFLQRKEVLAQTKSKKSKKGEKKGKAKAKAKGGMKAAAKKKA